MSEKTKWPLTDCGFRICRDREQPCCHCKKPTTGRNEDGSVAVCYRCYHNVNYTCTTHRCGEPVLPTKDKKDK